MTTNQLAKRLMYWLKRLNMDPWHIQLEVHELIDADDNNHASCGTSGDYLRAIIRFKEEYVRTATKQDIDQTLVHELLHCLFRDLESAWESVDELLGAVAAELHKERMRHEYEQLVDRLAVTLVAINTD